MATRKAAAPKADKVATEVDADGPGRGSKETGDAAQPSRPKLVQVEALSLSCTVRNSPDPYTCAAKLTLASVKWKHAHVSWDTLLYLPKATEEQTGAAQELQQSSQLETLSCFLTLAMPTPATGEGAVH